MLSVTTTFIVIEAKRQDYGSNAALNAFQGLVGFTDNYMIKLNVFDMLFDMGRQRMSGWTDVVSGRCLKKPVISSEWPIVSGQR